jgi:hypothetical protein
MAESEATAQRALDEATAISPKLTTQQQKVYLAIIRAQAYGTLGQDARSCEALKSVVSSAKGTSYESTLGGMLQSCP